MSPLPLLFIPSKTDLNKFMTVTPSTPLPTLFGASNLLRISTFASCVGDLMGDADSDVNARMVDREAPAVRVGVRIPLGARISD